MKNAVAIVLAGVIVGSAIVYTGSMDTYQMSATRGANEVPVAWRINTHTGKMIACYPEKQSNGKYRTLCD